MTFIPTVESTRVSDVPAVPVPRGQVPDVPDVPHPEEPVPDVPDVPFPDDAVSDLPEDDPDNILYQLPEVVEESSLNDPTHTHIMMKGPGPIVGACLHCHLPHIS